MLVFIPPDHHRGEHHQCLYDDDDDDDNENYDYCYTICPNMSLTLLPLSSSDH